MEFPFETLVPIALTTAVVYGANSIPEDFDIGDFIEDQALEALQGMELGEEPSESPLVKVIAKDDATITFLIRGRMKIPKTEVSAFIRMEASLSLTELSQPNVTTFIADIDIKTPPEPPVTEVKMGLGYDGLIFSGRGGARVIPVGLGLEIFLGGVSDRGIMLGINFFFPAPIPLGPIPLGLSGIGGDYAHNFKPRLEEGITVEPAIVDINTMPTDSEGLPPPTAIQFIQWARNSIDAPDRWVAAPIDETAIGVGLRAFFCDIATLGKVFQLDPLGFSVFTPGPVICLGGKGKLLGLDSIVVEANAVVDAKSKSFALGGAAELKLPEAEMARVLDVKGAFNAFFSFDQPSTWYISIGTKKKPIEAKFLVEYGAKAFFDINNYRVEFGVEVNWTSDFKVAKIFKIFVTAGFKLNALIGWNPKQIYALFGLGAEAGIKVWKFNLSVSLKGEVEASLPRPKFLKGKLEFKINTPPFIPDPKVTLRLPNKEENHTPDMEPALEIEFSTNAHVGALHKATNLQWDLQEPDAANLPWPDIQIVVPFSRRVTDKTGKILGAAVSSEISGSYEIKHELENLVITDASGVEVENITAAWIDAEGGETAQLHILARDPFHSMYWEHSQAESIIEVPAPSYFQTFGKGPAVTFDTPLRFREVVVTPQVEAFLDKSFDWVLPTRTIRAENYQIDFKTSSEIQIPIDQLSLFFIGINANTDTVLRIEGNDWFPANMSQIDDNLFLLEYRPTIPAGDTITGLSFSLVNLTGMTDDTAYLYAISYQEAREPIVTCSDEVLLEPGKYTLSLNGQTSATGNTEIAANNEPADIPWQLEQEFEIVAPNTARPYLKYTTVGDNRIFGGEKLGNNPTMLGIGFPAYRSYLPVIRFNVPYAASLFPELTLEMTFEGETTPIYTLTAVPTANGSNQSSISEQSRVFREWIGCVIPPDEEMEGTPITSDFGPTDVRLLHTPPGETTRIVDQWSCYISRHQHFSDHVSLDDDELDVFYDFEGVHSVPNCTLPESGFASRSTRRNSLDLSGDSLERDSSGLGLSSGVDSSTEVDVTVGFSFPDELDNPPFTWRLPFSLRRHLEAVNTPTAISYARFAVDTGAQFNNNPSHPMFGINNTLDETEVQAIADSQGRFYALWLRTAEPIDWRRVSASLEIRHLNGTDACDETYAFRERLDLEIEILPSPDGSSAFLVGSLNGIRTRLPRGEYNLGLSFDFDLDDLPKLRPSFPVGNQESTTLTFKILGGLNWPQPNTKMILTAKEMTLLSQINSTKI